MRQEGMSSVELEDAIGEAVEQAGRASSCPGPLTIDASLQRSMMLNSFKLTVILVVQSENLRLTLGNGSTDHAGPESARSPGQCQPIVLQ